MIQHLIDDRPLPPPVEARLEPTFHHIKGFENEFRSLPWQDDFDAIYRSTGVFTEERTKREE